MPGPPAHPMPHPSQLIPQKRRAPSHEGAQPHAEARHRIPPPAASSSAHQERGRVTCESCREVISFKDEDGAFTLKHWDAHRLKCELPGDGSMQPPLPRSASPNPANRPADLSMDTQPLTTTGPPPKRRRAKRTEEERIEYLRSDPFVAQFEAYRVLCGSCNKWIRLRPNSTYCSIPWDSHRKSCLAKNGKLNNIVSKSPVRTTAASTISRVTAPTRLTTAVPLNMSNSVTRSDLDSLDDADGDFEDELDGSDNYTPVSSHQPSRPSPYMTARPTTVPGIMHPPAAPTHLSPVSRHPPSSTHYGNDRRSPGTRQALPADPTIPSFPPHAFEVPSALVSLDMLLSPVSRSNSPREAGSTGGPTSPRAPSVTEHSRLGDESEHRRSSPEGSDRAASEPRRSHKARGSSEHERIAALKSDSLLGEVEPHRVLCLLCEKWVQLHRDRTYHARAWLEHRAECVAQNHRRVRKCTEVTVSPDSRRHQHLKVNEETGEYDATMKDEALAEENSIKPSRALHSRGSPPSGRLADLDSHPGRLEFIARSVSYLYATTYEQTDELPLPVLATYLNAAMPPEKHEEFDAVEVQRAIQDMPSRLSHIPLRLEQGDDGVMFLTTISHIAED